MVRFVLLAFLYFFLSFLCLCRSVEEPLQPGLEKGNRFPRIKRGQKKREKKKKKEREEEKRKNPENEKEEEVTIQFRNRFIFCNRQV